ncbi:zinc-dependent metalloprotease [Nocardia amikacinitolerans]|uniref:zinc-dependent metalloprotease n=1 Tax=Nocardia amikacinitolerans TaxID=756689 RepID=UPI0020A52597|nr:zinc-dependent metalloprotease [Nocardia amikacinitolerans]
MLRSGDRFDALFHAVPLPSPWSLEQYLASISTYRARPITLCPVDTTGMGEAGCGTGSGLWIARRDDDVIVYDRDTSGWHAQHIVLHEIGHMLLEHDRQDTLPTGVDIPVVGALLPSVSLEAIQYVLGRDAYDDVRERDAEAFADLAMVRAQMPGSPSASLRGTFFRGRRR